MYMCIDPQALSVDVRKTRSLEHSLKLANREKRSKQKVREGRQCVSLLLGPVCVASLLASGQSIWYKEADGR